MPAEVLDDYSLFHRMSLILAMVVGWATNGLRRWSLDIIVFLDFAIVSNSTWIVFPPPPQGVPSISILCAFFLVCSALRLEDTRLRQTLFSARIVVGSRLTCDNSSMDMCWVCWQDFGCGSKELLSDLVLISLSSPESAWLDMHFFIKEWKARLNSLVFFSRDSAIATFSTDTKWWPWNDARARLSIPVICSMVQSFMSRIADVKMKCIFNGRRKIQRPDCEALRLHQIRTCSTEVDACPSVLSNRSICTSLGSNSPVAMRIPSLFISDALWVSTMVVVSPASIADLSKSAILAW